MLAQDFQPENRLELARKKVWIRQMRKPTASAWCVFGRGADAGAAHDGLSGRLLAIKTCSPDS